MFNKCPHCLMIIPFGKVKCSREECKQERSKEAKAKRIERIKHRTPEYYLDRLRKDIKCTSCGKPYDCYHLNAKDLPINSYYGTCQFCKALRKAS